VSRSDPFPPFRQVLEGIDLPADAETHSFDLTIGRATPVASHGDGLESLPELSILLDAGTSPVDADLEVNTLIGRGGMGEVWLARQRSLGRDVAVKMPMPAADENIERALVAEARVTSALEHPPSSPSTRWAAPRRDKPFWS
jgi:serine/threonine-protein kinase